MATRKLSAAQREEIRRIIKKDLANGIPEAEILNAMAAKYSISYATARWYLRAVTSRNGSFKREQRRKTVPRARREGKKKNSDQGERLLELARGFSNKELRQAIAAKAVLPKLEIAHKHRDDLMAKRDLAQKKLQKAEEQVAEIQRKLSQLSKK